MVLNFSIQPMQNSEVEFCVGGIGLLAVSQKLRVGFSNLLELARRVLNRNPQGSQPQPFVSTVSHTDSKKSIGFHRNSIPYYSMTVDISKTATVLTKRATTILRLAILTGILIYCKRIIFKLITNTFYNIGWHY